MVTLAHGYDRDMLSEIATATWVVVNLVVLDVLVGLLLFWRMRP